MTSIPDHLIDKAARAFQRLTCRYPLPAWEDTPAHVQDMLREDASAILDAVADDLRAEAWDQLSELIEDEVPFSVADEYPNPYRTEQS